MAQYTHALVAIALSAAASGTFAQWEQSWNFDNGSAWETPVVGQGSYDKSGYGQGLYPRSWNSSGQTTTAFAPAAGVAGTGAMQYTSGDVLGGLRLHLADNNLTDFRNNDFTPAMSAQYNPSASISFHSGGSGVAYFYTYATSTPNTTFNTGAGFYEAIVINLGAGTVSRFGNDAPSGSAAILSNDWNDISIDMDSSGALSFSLNGSTFSSGNRNNNSYTHMADAWDSAIGIFNLGGGGSVDMLFDNFVVASNIPTPASAALLGFAGIAAARRRR